MSVLSTLGGADDSYMQYALLAVLTGAVLINLKTFPGVWHVGEINQRAIRKKLSSLLDALLTRCFISFLVASIEGPFHPISRGSIVSPSDRYEWGSRRRSVWRDSSPLLLSSDLASERPDGM